MAGFAAGYGKAIHASPELLVHGKPAEVSTTAFDALLAVELETLPVEEWPGRKTDVGSHYRGVDRLQCGLDTMVKAAGDTATGERGMSVKKIEVSLGGVGSKAREYPADSDMIV